jgi:hypothetical protein
MGDDAWRDSVQRFCTPLSACPEGGSIFRRLLRPVDYQKLHRPLDRFQFQPELSLEDCENVGQRIVTPSGRSQERRKL